MTQPAGYSGEQLVASVTTNGSPAGSLISKPKRPHHLDGLRGFRWFSAGSTERPRPEMLLLAALILIRFRRRTMAPIDRFRIDRANPPQGPLFIIINNTLIRRRIMASTRASSSGSSCPRHEPLGPAPARQSRRPMRRVAGRSGSANTLIVGWLRK